eukprot:355754-Chlamydomonas_euryale.AAC.25
MLTAEYLKDIVRPPPTGGIPANVAHPFQTSFYTYVTKKFLPRHWYLAAGATFTLTLYGTLDSLREAGKKSAYDEAVAAGRPPLIVGGEGDCTRETSRANNIKPVGVSP